MVRDKDINSWREKYIENYRDKRVAGIMREKYMCPNLHFLQSFNGHGQRMKIQ